jgi:uncharacterized coiled-coil protein SlyX
MFKDKDLHTRIAGMEKRLSKQEMAALRLTEDLAGILAAHNNEVKAVRAMMDLLCTHDEVVSHSGNPDRVNCKRCGKGFTCKELAELVDGRKPKAQG